MALYTRLDDRTVEMLRDCTNRSRPSSRGTSVKALVSGRTSEGTAKELSALSSALRFCREETKVSLTKLARLTKASGISEDAIETLKIRIKDFAEQKNNVLDELDLEVDSLREGFWWHKTKISAQRKWQMT